MTWIRTIPPDQADADLRRRYENLYALYPPEYRDDFMVLHDGVNVERFRRKAAPGWQVPRTIAARTLTPQARVVTFVALPNGKRSDERTKSEFEPRGSLGSQKP